MTHFSDLEFNFHRLKKLTGMFFCVAASGFLAFFKTFLIANLFQISVISDAYFIFSSLLASVTGFIKQAAQSLMVPAYNKQGIIYESEPVILQHQDRVVSLFMNYFATLSLLLALTCFYFYQPLIGMFSHGTELAHNKIALLLMRYTLPICILLQVGAGLPELMLQRRQRSAYFFQELAGGVILILLLIILAYFYNAYALIWAIPLAQLVVLMLQYTLTRFSWQWEWNLKKFDYGLRDIAPRLASIAFFFSIPLLDNYYLSFLPVGELSVFRYALTLVTALALLTVMNAQKLTIPYIMELGSHKDYPQLKKALTASILEMTLISVVVGGMAYLTSPFWIKLLFHFHEDIASKQLNLMIFSFQILLFKLPTISALSMTTACFNALDLGREQFENGLRAFILRLAGGWLGVTLWGLPGILITHVLENLVIVVINFIILNRVINQAIKNKKQGALQAS